MRICDRCHKSGDTKQATNSVTFEQDDEKSDLCHTCSEEVRDFIHGSRDSNVIGKAKKDTPPSV